MARRLVSTMVRMKGGPTLGGSPTRVTVYDDEALTVVSTLYQRATGAGQQPNALPTSGGPHLTPNAGKQTTLRSDAASGATVLNVVSIASFAKGDLVPIFDGTNIRWRVITDLNAVGPTMTVDSALGVAFDSDNTFINRPSMRGHIWFWVDDVRDYFIQTYDVGAAEQMPPLQLPTRVPATALAVQEEGVSVGAARSTLNFIGANVLAADDAGNLRTNITISGLATDVQVFTASGTWTKPAGVPKLVQVIVIGAGGGGGGGEDGLAGTVEGGGGGGGGGAYSQKWFHASALGATETVTVGAGGSGGGSELDGIAGGDSSFGTLLIAGGGGRGGGQSGGGGGGGGGGPKTAGGNATAGVNGLGAPPGETVGPNAIGLGGADGGNPAGCAEWGGAGGAVGVDASAVVGGSSLYAAAGGGSGGGVTSGDVGVAGGAGGSRESYTSGGGGAGGTAPAGAGGSGGASLSGTGRCGSGGGGGGGATGAAVGGVGGAGQIPGGGGGGGGAGVSGGGTGGAGARGEVICITYF